MAGRRRCGRRWRASILPLDAAHRVSSGSERITGKRTTAFCRLGTGWGSHRYGVFFTGDLHGVWESLPVLIPATVRGGNQLMPYMNNLCGGVFTRRSAGGALSALGAVRVASARSSGSTASGGCGCRGNTASEGVETYRKFVGPALRAAALHLHLQRAIAHETGLPLVRGMYLEYPDQEPAYTFEQQYLFGEDLLGGADHRAGQGKAVPKDVFLPAGDDWFDYFTGDIYEGGQIIVHECPIDRMPLFVRAGSIIPMAPEMDQRPEARRSADARRLCEAVDPPSGGCMRTMASPSTTGKVPSRGRRFHSSRGPMSGQFTLTIKPAEGKFAGQLKKRSYLIKVHGLLEPESVSLNGRDMSDWSWDPAMRVTSIRLNRPLSTSESTLSRPPRRRQFRDRY